MLDYIFTFPGRMAKLSDLSTAEWDALTNVFTDAEISAQFGLSRTAATYVRKKHGILSFAEKTGKRKYKDFYSIKPSGKRAFSYRKSGANENYFSNVDSPRKAYWLGLIAADGWIVTEGGTPTGFAIALKQDDSYLLKQFAIDLGCPEMYRKEREGSDLWQVKLTSDKAANDLIEFGIVPKKSKALKLPTLSENFFGHWLRGYFDGDGSVSIRKNTLAAKITSGSEQVLLSIQRKLNAKGVKTSITTDNGVFNLCTYSENALRFGSILYGSPHHNEICLLRKKQMFDQFKVKV